eukprot:GHVU01079827.1.p1 GENE.GHVU01079827.1~~GHVU01079827.1.p1  ORF type:complete len:294 (+),score=62.26 GHVU01079827.1:712-1593(+)
MGLPPSSPSICFPRRPRLGSPHPTRLCARLVFAAAVLACAARASAQTVQRSSVDDGREPDRPAASFPTQLRGRLLVERASPVVPTSTNSTNSTSSTTTTSTTTTTTTTTTATSTSTTTTSTTAVQSPSGTAGGPSMGAIAGVVGVTIAGSVLVGMAAHLTAKAVAEKPDKDLNDDATKTKKRSKKSKKKKGREVKEVKEVEEENDVSQRHPLASDAAAKEEGAKADPFEPPPQVQVGEESESDSIAPSEAAASEAAAVTVAVKDPGALEEVRVCAQPVEDEETNTKAGGGTLV